MRPAQHFRAAAAATPINHHETPSELVKSAASLALVRHSKHITNTCGQPRGGSFTLKVYYCASQQIRQSADRLLPSVLRDVDGIEDERRGTISVFDGPEPAVVVSATQAEEIAAVRAFVESAMSDGIVPTEIGIFVRTPSLVKRAKSSVLGLAGADGITVNIMHLAKGLEFRAVAVMACDEGILPLDARIEDATDDAEMDDIYETERRLLYVACTRARDRLMVSGVEPASEYLTDMLAG